MGFLSTDEWQLEVSPNPRLWIPKSLFDKESIEVWSVISVSPKFAAFFQDEKGSRSLSTEEECDFMAAAHLAGVHVQTDRALFYMNSTQWKDAVPKSVGMWLLEEARSGNWKWIEMSGVAVPEEFLLESLNDYHSHDMSIEQVREMVAKREDRSLDRVPPPVTLGMTESEYIHKILEKQYPDSAWWKSHPYFELAEKQWAAANEEYRKAQEDHHRRNPMG